MKARDLCSPHASVSLDDPVSEAVRLLTHAEARGVLVIDAEGRLAGVLSSEAVLRQLLPSYVTEAEALAGVLDEATSETLWRRLALRRVGDVLPHRPEVMPEVDVGDSLIEVASTMLRARTPLVGVVEQGRLVGGITLYALLDRLIPTG
jgi:CBS domain-containing protein